MDVVLYGVEAAKSLADLEGKLTFLRKPEENRIAFLRRVQRIWEAERHEKAIGLARRALEDTPRLPDTAVHRPEATYHLHGIVHGTNPLYSVALSASGNVRTWLQREAMSLPGKIFYEQHLGKLTGVPGEEIRDHYLGRQRTRTQRVTRMIPLAITAPLVQGVTAAVCPPLRLLTRSGYLSGPGLGMLATKSVLAQLAAHTFDAHVALPEPLGMELDTLLWTEARSWRVARKLLGLNDVASPAARSAYMAETMRLKGGERNHLICGDRHVKQVAYFLRNPTYKLPRTTSGG